MRLGARLTRKIDVCSEEQAQESAASSAMLQALIVDGLIEDFEREIFLDNHPMRFVIVARPRISWKVSRRSR